MIKLLLILFSCPAWVFGFIFYLNSAPSSFSEEIKYYVSVNGSDENTGTPAQPFLTIQKARDIVRLQPTTQDIRVRIMPGRYAITNAISFTNVLDGGTGVHRVIYEAFDPANPPVIDGGSPVGTGGWINEAGNLWYTTIPSGWNFRRLYADGERQIRAREPDFDLGAGVSYGGTYLRSDPQYPSSTVRQIDLPAGLPEVLSFTNAERTIFSSSTSFPSVQQSDCAEIVTFGHWNSTRAPLSNVSGSLVESYNRMGISGIFHLDFLVGEQFYLEHAKSFLDTQGEWWRDEAGNRLYVYSTNSPSGRMFWATQSDQLIRVVGTSGSPVCNLEFHHLIFQGANWVLPDDSCIGSQADYYVNRSNVLCRMPAAVLFEYVSNCVLRSCMVLNTAANAIAMERGCQNSSVESCWISDVGAGGVVAGHKDEALGSDVGKSANISIQNNVIMSCGTDFLGAQGIWANYVPNVRISRNTVLDIGYTGISVGYNWADGATRQRNAVVEKNDICGVMKYFFDGAGVYLVGNQGGAVVRNNYIHDSLNAKGLQFDQGSSFLTASNNLIVGCSIGMALNSGHDRSVKNNIFSDMFQVSSGAAALGVHQTLYTNQQAVLFEKNIICRVASNLVFSIAHPEYVPAVINSNLYFDCAVPRGFALSGWGGDPANWLSWTQWQALGYDTGGYTNLNPNFVDAAGSDFRFVNTSTVNSSIGFTDWDKYDVGSALVLDYHVPIVWTNLVGVVGDGDSLTKTSTSVGWDAGAASSQSSVGDVGVHFKAQWTDTSRMCGLSTNDTDAGYTSIDYAWQLDVGGSLKIYEKGVWKGAFGSYQTGDTFVVERVGNEVRYLYNGTIMRVSTNAPRCRLMADCSLCNPGATILDATIYILGHPIQWTNSVGVTAVNNSLAKIGGTTGWNAGASSATKVSEDVGIFFSAQETNTSRMCGLSVNDTDAHYTSIDYAWQLDAGGGLKIYENGVSRGVFGSYLSGDIFAIERINGKICYFQNSEVRREVTNATSAPLLVDCSLCQVGATVQNVCLYTPVAPLESSIQWANVQGVSVIENTLIKTEGNGWGNGGAASTQGYDGNIGVYFVAGEINLARMCGLSTNDVNASYDSIGFALYLQSNGTVSIYELGENRGSFGTYSSGDTFAVERVDSTVRYLHNGIVIRTVTCDEPLETLRADTSLYHVNSTLRSMAVY